MLNFKTNHKQAALKELICHADAILIGAGAGLSASAGLTYSGSALSRTLQTFVKSMEFPICTPAVLPL